MYIYIYTYSQTWIQDQFTPAPGSLFAPAEAADVVNYSDFIDSINRGEATLPVLERPTVTNGMCFFRFLGCKKNCFFRCFRFFRFSIFSNMDILWMEEILHQFVTIGNYKTL